MKAGFNLAGWGAAGVLAVACAYFIGKELFPIGHMAPNTVMSNSWEIVRNDHNVQLKYGDDLKCYGTDKGGSREGRRNFVESTPYISKDDNTHRMRIRYNIEGGSGRTYGFVFAEVADFMKTGEFVYILVQDRRTGSTMTLIDNRSEVRVGGGGKGEGGKEKRSEGL